jgi:DHA2 family multidrug resistance protein-like MFS transporter
MLDLSLFRNRTFATALTITMVGATTMGGIFLLVSQYLQFVAGLSTVQAGLALVPQAVAVVIGSMIAPRMTKYVRREIVLGFGMLIAAVGILLFTMLDGGVVLVVLGTSISAFGMGPQGVLCTEMVVGSVSPRKAGAASALSETGAEFGMAMGIAVFGSIGTAVYRGGVTVPADLPAEAVATAKESMAGALNVASGLPDATAGALVSSAREAFTGGVQTVAVVVAVVVTTFALIGMTVLRNKKAAEVVTAPAEDEELVLVH